MTITAVRKRLKDILPLRALFLQENNFEVRYDACHERGWSDSYLLKAENLEIGYGSIKGQERDDRDTVFEFYLIPSVRKFSSLAFRELLTASRARFVECQSNDKLLSSMLFEFTDNIHADTVLFEDSSVTEHSIPGAEVRRKNRKDLIFADQSEPAGEFVLELRDEILATGGFFLHYNMPFADLYMEVHPDHWGHGYGSFLLQEVKRQCYLAGRVPAARCNIENTASRATLIKAGMRVCGFMLRGHVKSKD